MNEHARARAFEAWRKAARGESAPQRPEQQLLAEHHLMLAVLEAMDAEARRLLDGGVLRPEFWRGVVEFIGNFSHRVHRVKEERFFFPALEAWGLATPEICRHIADDHEKLKELTWLLCDGVNEGDWEKTFRVVAMYLDRMRSHIHAEEQQLLSPALAEVDAERVRPVAEGFAALEAETLGPEGRLGYLEITRSVCDDVGITPPSAAQGSSP
jgi:hemerythrin-like domain-containing protein